MTTGTFVFIACMSGLLLNAAAQDEPRHSKPKMAETSKKKPAANDDEDEAKPAKKPLKKKAVDADDEDAKPAKKKAVPKGSDDEDKPVKKKTQAKGDDDEDKPAKDKKTDGEPAKKKDGDTPTEGNKVQAHPPAVSSISADELEGFDEYPDELKTIIGKALDLTHLNLAYTFGASSPSEGGMDCSGTIYYLLTQHGMKNVPRSSDEICEWVRQKSGMHLAPDGVELSHDSFNALRPGDLLFWTGTYDTLPRRLPVSHIMMYLGKLKKNGRPVVFGSSDGRYYAGQRRSGVSVFDFSMPRSGGKAAFYGYGTIPGMSKAKTQEEVRRALPPPGKELVMADKKEEKNAEEEPKPKEVAKAETEPSNRKAVPSGEDEGKPVKARAKASAKDEEEPAAKPKASTVAKSSDNGDAPKKKLLPQKSSSVRKKSTVAGARSKRKAESDDDTDPGAVVRKAVNSIKKVFD